MPLGAVADGQHPRIARAGPGQLRHFAGDAGGGEARRREILQPGQDGCGLRFRRGIAQQLHLLEPAGDPSARETVRTTHHEQPRYIYAKGAPKMVTPAPMVNHTDAELEMLEALVGRKPPFKGKRRY